MLPAIIVKYENREEKAMLSKKDFYKMVISMVIPIALQNLINVGVTTADVGKSIGNRFVRIIFRRADFLYHDFNLFRHNVGNYGPDRPVLGKAGPGRH